MARADHKEIKDAERCVLFIPTGSKKVQAAHKIVELDDHLMDPLRGTTIDKVYNGAVVMAVGCYGNAYLNPTLMDSQMGDTEDPHALDEEYWFLDSFREFLYEAQFDFDTGKVYAWRGTMVPRCEAIKEDEGTEHEYESRCYSLEWKGSLEELGNFNLDAA